MLVCLVLSWLLGRAVRWCVFVPVVLFYAGLSVFTCVVACWFVAVVVSSVWF